MGGRGAAFLEECNPVFFQRDWPFMLPLTHLHKWNLLGPKQRTPSFNISLWNCSMISNYFKKVIWHLVLTSFILLDCLMHQHSHAIENLKISFKTSFVLHHLVCFMIKLQLFITCYQHHQTTFSLIIMQNQKTKLSFLWNMVIIDSPGFHNFNSFSRFSITSSHESNPFSNSFP